MLWQSKLLHWYRKNRRDLPWRRTSDPYCIWVSEIMLQQTTVEAVIPYYEKFLKKFPDVASLAKADEEDVLKLWSGLGYYSRARNLHKAAKIMSRSGPVASEKFCRRTAAAARNFSSHHPTGTGFLPNTVSALQQLPGIGRYTAGAIASIAFDIKAPIVDGNVIRVLSRLFRIKEDPRSTAGREVFWRKAEEILPDKNVGDFNQALMELGATVCHPTSPECGTCSLSSHCEAKLHNDVENFPAGKKKVRYREVRMMAALIEQDGRVLLVRRPNRGVLKGLWEVPMVEGNQARLKKDWSVSVIRELKPIRHSVLDRRLIITPALCSFHRLPDPQSNHLWIQPLESLPATSSMNQKLIQAFLDFRNSQ